MNNIIQMLIVLDNLSRIPRLGGILFAGIDPDNIDSDAEHCYKVCYISLLYSELLDKAGHKINFRKLLTAAITHDWADTIVLDIPSASPSYQSYFGGKEFRQLIKQGEENALKAIEQYLSKHMIIDLGDKNITEPERTILEAADITALLIDVLEWKFQGAAYEWFDYMWSNTMLRLKNTLDRPEGEALRFMTSDLEKAWQKGTKPPHPFLTKPEFQSYKPENK